MAESRSFLIPEENTKDLVEIPDNVKNKLDIHPVKWIEQVLEMALERKPEPLPEPEVATVTAPPVVNETGALACNQALTRAGKRVANKNSLAIA